MMTGGLPSVDELRALRKAAEDKKAAEAQAREQQRLEGERLMHEAFLAGDIDRSEAARERFNKLVRHAAEVGQDEMLVMRFPSRWCNDLGRRINSGAGDWPDSLEGHAKQAYLGYLAFLQPLGFTMRAQIMDYPDGNLGEVGLFLRW